jgi:hypothetical protein
MYPSDVVPKRPIETAAFGARGCSGLIPFTSRATGDSEGMGERRRVVFLFAGRIAVHTLCCLPEIGDLVAHDREMWLVTSVESHPVGVLVVCELPGLR